MLSNDSNSGRNDPLVCCIKVIDLEEESDPSTSLVPDNRYLLRVVRTGQDDARLSTCWQYDNPPLGLPTFVLR